MGQIIDLKRLIADEGKVYTNGEIKGKVIDVLATEVDRWYEIDDEEEQNNG